MLVLAFLCLAHTAAELCTSYTCPVNSHRDLNANQIECGTGGPVGGRRRLLAEGGCSYSTCCIEDTCGVVYANAQRTCASGNLKPSTRCSAVSVWDQGCQCFLTNVTCDDSVCCTPAMNTCATAQCGMNRILNASRVTAACGSNCNDTYCCQNDVTCDAWQCPPNTQQSSSYTPTCNSTSLCTDATCCVTFCTDPPNNISGLSTVIYPDSGPGSFMYVTCICQVLSGGPNQVVCDATSAIKPWVLYPWRCSEAFCINPPQNTSAYYVTFTNGSHDKSVATFNCNPGYAPSSNATCNSCGGYSLDWSPPDSAPCGRTVCFGNLSLANGFVTYSDANFHNSVATFACSVNNSNPPAPVVCSAPNGNATWPSIVGSCPSTNSCNGWTCGPGSVPTSGTCAGTCIPSDCCTLTNCTSPPTQPANGFVVFSNVNLYLSVATFSCATGFHLVGAPTLQCDATNSTRPWPGPAPVCSPNVCTCANGVATLYNTSDCFRQCQTHGAEDCGSCASGYFVNPQPGNQACRITTCYCDHGTPAVSSGSGGTLCVIPDEVDCSNCSIGYHLDTPADVSTRSHCFPNQCTSPPLQLPNGHAYFTNGNNHQSVAFFSCNVNGSTPPANLTCSAPTGDALWPVLNESCLNTTDCANWTCDAGTTARTPTPSCSQQCDNAQCCMPNVCTCPNGFPSTSTGVGGSLCVANQVDCQACNVGFLAVPFPSASTNSTCQPNVCSCPFGTPTNATGSLGTLCETNGTVDCSACNTLYVLTSPANLGLQTCRPVVCTCPFGTVTTQGGSGATLCQTDGAVDCSACISGYVLSATAGLGNQICQPNLCTCSNGAPTVFSGSGPTFCEVNGTEDCISCNAGYRTTPGTGAQSCLINVCLCPNGTASIGNGGADLTVLCELDGAVDCQSCAAGFHPSQPFGTGNQTCQPNTCVCAAGTPVTGALCTSNFGNICASCGSGFHLNNSVCTPNNCTCPGGTATVFQGSGPTFCEVDGSVDCSACSSGYHASASFGTGSQPCNVDTCTCQNGTTTTGAGSGPTKCERDGAVDCAACAQGYHLNETAGPGAQICERCPNHEIQQLMEGCVAADFDGVHGCSTSCDGLARALADALSRATPSYSIPDAQQCVKDYNDKYAPNQFQTTTKWTDISKLQNRLAESPLCPRSSVTSSAARLLFTVLPFVIVVLPA